MSRRAWAVVPAKSLARGKSRLRPVLDDAARTELARGMLDHVLGTLAAAKLEGILVATDGDDVAELAARHGAEVTRDDGTSGLADVVDRALGVVASRGATAALVLMADLPRIVPGDVHEVLASLDDHDVVIVRDHQGRHTNALAMAPPAAMPTSFGRPDSFEAHGEAARSRGLRVTVLENKRIAFDVDLPADHSRLTP